MKHSKIDLHGLLAELLIPLLALGFLAVYWWQAIGLSGKAQAFPSIVTAGALLLIAIQCVTAVKASLSPHGRTDGATQENGTSHWLTASLVQRAGLLIIAAVIMYFWRDAGATIGIFVFLLTALFILGERRPMMLIAFPSILTALLAYLFQVVLTVIFPSGLFSLF